MSPHNEQLIQDIEKARRLVILGLFAAIVVFVLFEALRGEHYWVKVKAEGNLWNYGSSLMYFMAGEMAIVNAILLAYYGKVHGQVTRSWSWMAWAAAGAAFVFFACDEMLEVHEKVGLAMERSIPWLHRMFPNRVDGLIIAGYAIGAILFSISFFRGPLISREARAYFIWGFVTIGLASGLDATPRHLYINYLPLRETEELLELFAGFAFTAAFISSGAVIGARILHAFDSEAGPAAPKPRESSAAEKPGPAKRLARRDVPMIGALIVTWNRSEDLLECIGSVLLSGYPRLAVYVVDNGSSDGSSRAIAERYPEVRVIRSEENLGFAGGSNLGLTRMLEDGMDAVFLLNDDVVVAEDTLAQLAEVVFSDPTVGAVAPKVLAYSAPNTIWAAGGLIDPRGVAVQRNYGETDRGQADEVSEIDYAVGCAMLVKSDVIRQVGLMDPRYFMYYEEADWCRRIRGAGYRILYVPRGRAWHKVSLDGDERNHASYYFSRNRLLYLSADGAGPGRVAWTALSDVVRSAVIHAVKGRRHESRLMVRAVLDYYRGDFGRFRDGT